ncbi:MAG: hypothetical protein KME45_19885 [Stenomitos rutilans HA7619-LM2]|nr:hypothetical protein [Stenomitos rutilans HA7619-LM2]
MRDQARWSRRHRSVIAQHRLQQKTQLEKKTFSATLFHVTAEALSTTGLM